MLGDHVSDDGWRPLALETERGARQFPEFLDRLDLIFGSAGVLGHVDQQSDLGLEVPLGPDHGQVDGRMLQILVARQDLGLSDLFESVLHGLGQAHGFSFFIVYGDIYRGIREKP